MQILETLLTIFLVGIPILIWGYVFSFFDGLEFQLHRFAYGVIAWALSVLPIVYSHEIYDFSGIDSFIGLLGRIHFQSSFIIDFIVSFWLPVLVFLLILAILAFQTVWKSKFRILKVVLGLSLVVTAVATVLSYVPAFGDGYLKIQGSELMSFSAICMAYVFIASLEESLKHFSSYVSLSENIPVRKNILLFAVYSALGFVFLENILYLTSVAEVSGMASGSFFGTLFSRSVISLLLHLFASLILVLGFYDWCVTGNFRSSLRFVIAFWIAVAVHAIFDISLTYGKMWIIVLYAIVGYFFFTKVFFDERKIETA